MLDNGLAAPQVSKFSRHLPTDPLHDPYFIQSVGWLQASGNFFGQGWENVWGSNKDFRVKSLQESGSEEEKRSAKQSDIYYSFSSSFPGREGCLHMLMLPYSVAGAV